MRLTVHEARALGIDPELIEAATRDRRPPSLSPDDGLNKLERSFRDEVLAPAFDRGDIGRFDREPLKFRLAGRCWYTPDFVVWRESICIEVKGFMRDDAAVKIKVAAATYPGFRWWLVRREGRHGWEVRFVDRMGIGREPIRVPWIHGG